MFIRWSFICLCERNYDSAATWNWMKKHEKKKKTLAKSVLQIKSVCPKSNHIWNRLFFTQILSCINEKLTSSSKISRWWTWIVMRVSNLVLSTLVRLRVVWLMRVLSRSKKRLLQTAMTLRSVLALVRASVESLVQISWIPSKPICEKRMFQI